MSLLVSTLLHKTTGTFQSLLAPIPPFDSPALPNISTLDVLGALRLSIVLRQIRRKGAATTGVKNREGELWWHDLAMTLLIVFGGEVVAC